MTDAHTPGPWTARRMHTGGFDIMDPRNRDVVTVYGGGVETESREANARLIAAAPDLLDALKRARRYVADLPIVGDDDLAVIDAAILKANHKDKP